MNKIIQGDSLAVLKTLPDESVDCCITSPPYWGLRDYGTAKWEGGDSDCEHKEAKLKSRYDYSLASSPIQDGERKGTDAPKWKDICPSCGARKIDNQLGLEKTPEEYVEKMVQVFCEVRRVLKREGTLWLNLGDSYASNGKEGGDIDKDNGMDIERGRGRLNRHKEIKPKDLVGIPWMVAFALRKDGWYLRQDIIWAKPNPMPESVTDRCTKSHEYVFLMSKSPKYFYDNEAVKEEATSTDESERDRDVSKLNNTPGRTRMAGLTTNHYTKRNRRSVWTVTTKPYKEAHFATYPEELIEPMILAGCPKEGIVLDPFLGSGTTAAVAKRLGRNYLGIELSPAYIKLAEKRIAEAPTPML